MYFSKNTIKSSEITRYLTTNKSVRIQGPPYPAIRNDASQALNLCNYCLSPHPFSVTPLLQFPVTPKLYVTTNVTFQRLIILFTRLLFFLLLPATAITQPVLNFTTGIPSGLTDPVDVVNAGDGTNRIFIVERGGAIKAFDAVFNSLGTFLTVTGLAPWANRACSAWLSIPTMKTTVIFLCTIPIRRAT